jgi:hypothetical protein
MEATTYCTRISMAMDERWLHPAALASVGRIRAVQGKIKTHSLKFIMRLLMAVSRFVRFRPLYIISPYG